VPGTPHHALGHPLLTVLATTALAAVVVGTLAVGRSRFSDALAYAAVGGLAYGLVYLALWALVPAVFWRFAIDPLADPAFAVGSVAVGALALSLQGALGLYAHARWSLRAPLLGLAATSWVCGYLFLRVGGESGATFMLLLWSVALAPLAVLAVAALGGLEAGIRRLTAHGTT
jgi:hypothetical protein